MSDVGAQQTLQGRDSLRAARQHGRRLSGAGARRTLPPRDWLLLPLVAVVTALVFLVIVEGGSRLVWPESKDDVCAYNPLRPKANCVSHDKAAEGPWVEARFNACGYRSTGPCGPVSSGTARLAVIGSSTSWGFLVPFDDVWSVQAAKQITAKCGRPIDVQSLSGFGDLNLIAARTPEVLALHPQLVALVIGPFDLFKLPDGGFNPAHALLPSPEEAPHHPGLMEWLEGLLSDSRAVEIAQHYIFGNPDAYVATYLRYGDRAAYLRPPMSQAWQARLDVLNEAVAYITARLAPSGTRLLLVYAPPLVQADLIASGKPFPGVDPEAIDRAMAQIAKRHGALFTDGGEGFRGLGSASDYFYRAEGHLNSAGQTLLGRTAAKSILAAALPSFCSGSPQ